MAENTPSQTTNNEFNQERREFLSKSTVAIVGFIGGVSLGAATKLGEKAVDGATYIYKEVGKRMSYSDTQLGMLFELFDLEDKAQVVPGDRHPWQTGIHPDDQIASGNIRSFFLPNEKNHKEPDKLVDPTLSSYCLGSPQSNAVALANMEYERLPNGTLKRKTSPLVEHHIKYNFFLPDQNKPLAKRYVGKKITERAIYSVDSPWGTFESDPLNGWLAKDILVISRIPNICNQKTVNNGRDIIVFGGLHGTATKAIDLLFKDLSIMDSIQKDRQSKRYFQSLFVIPRIKHDEVHKTSISQAIEYIGTQPLDIKRLSLSNKLSNVPSLNIESC